MSSGVHVLPVNDLIEHSYEDCICGPDLEFIDPESGVSYPSGPLVIHHSLDGREATEDGLPAPESFLAEHEAREILRDE